MFVRPSFDVVLEAVCKAFDETPTSIRQRSHRASRKALSQLSYEQCGLTLTAIGQWLGLTDRAVSHLVRRGRLLESGNAGYALRLRDIRVLIEGRPSTL